MKRLVLIAIAVIATALAHTDTALAQTNRPNILVIFGDDIGINNISGIVTLSEIGPIWTIKQQAKSLKSLASISAVVGKFRSL